MRVGVIGTGRMGTNHIRVYSELKEVDEVYAFDTDKERLQSIGTDGLIVCDSARELLGLVDAVSICAPTRYHANLATEAVGAGVACLIEKPITSTVKEGEKLVELLEKSGVVAGVGHIERFNPIVGVIESIIDRPLYVEMKRHNPASARITDSTVVEDLMIHDLDIIFNLLFHGDYEIASAGDADLCMALIRFGSDVVAVSASRKASKKIRSIYIEEEDLTIEGDFMSQEVYIYKKPGKYSVEDGGRYRQENIIEKVMVNKTEPLKEELRRFIRCVEDGEEFAVTPAQALKNLRICEEIKRLNGILQTPNSDRRE